MSEKINLTNEEAPLESSAQELAEMPAFDEEAARAAVVEAKAARTTAEMTKTENEEGMLPEDENGLYPEEPVDETIGMQEVITAARAEGANDPNYPEIFWVSPDKMQVTIGDLSEVLTPEQALEKYGDNELFMKEYDYLTNSGKVTSAPIGDILEHAASTLSEADASFVEPRMPSDGKDYEMSFSARPSLPPMDDIKPKESEYEIPELPDDEEADLPKPSLDSETDVTEG